MTSEHQRSKELPQYAHVVVTDVDRRSDISAVKAIRSISPGPNWSIHEASNYKELFDMALQGNLIGGPQLVVLDDNYAQYSEEWAFSETKRGDQLANQLMRRGMKEENAYWLARPTAVNFAAALRLFGYDGKIIIATQVAPEERKIKEVERSLGDLFLIDGISLKSNFPRPISAIHRIKTPSGISLEGMNENGRFKESLSWLLPRVLI